MLLHRAKQDVVEAAKSKRKLAPCTLETLTVHTQRFGEIHSSLIRLHPESLGGGQEEVFSQLPNFNFNVKP